MADFGKATHADAELVLKLYDMRREPVMREARKFLVGFFPQSAEDILGIVNAFGSQENAYFRQVVGYWEMAASLVLRGSLHEGLFLDNAGELFFVYGKFAPFINEIRAELGPQVLARCEELINHTSEGQQRLSAVIARQKKLAERRAAQSAR